MNNRIAITTIENGNPLAPLVLRGDLGKVIPEVRKHGFDALEIHVIDPHAFDCARVNSLCRNHHIDIAAIVTGQMFVRRGLSMVDNDKTVREKALAELEDYISLAAEVHAKDGIVIGWVRGKRPDNDDGSYDELLAKGLTHIGTYAENLGQKILVEVINRYETNTFLTAQETLDFITRYNLPNTFIHMDTFHMNIEEVDTGASIRGCGDKLGYIHFADSNRHYPGAGHFDFIPVMQALSDISYKGSLSLECIPLPDSETAARESIRAIHSLMNISY